MNFKMGDAMIKSGKVRQLIERKGNPTLLLAPCQLLYQGNQHRHPARHPHGISTEECHPSEIRNGRKRRYFGVPLITSPLRRGAGGCSTGHEMPCKRDIPLPLHKGENEIKTSGSPARCRQPRCLFLLSYYTARRKHEPYLRCRDESSTAGRNDVPCGPQYRDDRAMYPYRDDGCFPPRTK